MGLFDVHAHLTHPRLASQVDEIIDRAKAVGLTSVVCNGLNPKDNQAVLDLAKRHPMVKPALGLYPVDAVLLEMRAAGVDYPREDEECSADQGIAFVRDHIEEAFAVGEIGLDGYWVPEQLFDRQDAVFIELVKLAMAADKAIIIHTRKRERRAFDILQELGATRVDWHCFGGKVKLARVIADAGYHLSIPANARRSQSFTRMLETIPRSQLLLETDCPYLGPEPGTDNEPKNVLETLTYAAELWGVSPSEAQAQLEDNFESLFRQRP